MENPKCNTCKKEWKPDETDIKKNGEVYKTCKKCREKEKNKKRQPNYNKEYRINRNEKLKENIESGYSVCSSCNLLWKPKDTDIKKSGKVYKTCNDCRNKSTIYFNENVEKVLENGKKWRLENPDKTKDYYNKNIIEKREYSNNYRKENPEKCKQSQKIWREKIKCDHNKSYGKCKICNLNRYIINIQRKHIARCLKSSSLNKEKTSIKYLGCDVEHFKDYFKKKMDLWNETNDIKMNWDNIHIDHIKPINAFNFDEENELNKCCNYTNLQPLLATDNLNKHNKWTDEDKVYWNENIKGKEHIRIYIGK